MLRVYKVLLVGLVLLLLGGCANLSWTTAGKIIPPAYALCPLEGKWMISQDLQTSGNSGESQENWVGDSAQFTGEIARLGDNIWNNPTYKLKQVNSLDYLMTKYLNLSSSIVPDSKEVESPSLELDSWGIFSPTRTPDALGLLCSFILISLWLAVANELSTWSETF